jgi:membrane protease YdiL (CAAX protease family)
MIKWSKLKLYLISKDIKKDFMWGAGFGAVFIILNLLTGIVIGLPVNPMATVEDKYLVAGTIAPIVEEFLFRSVLLSLFSFLPVFLNVIFNGVVFSGFHWNAYGQSLQAMNGSFIGAGLFGMFASYITINRKSIIPAIICHAVFNIWILSKYFVIVAI